MLDGFGLPLSCPLSVVSGCHVHSLPEFAKTPVIYDVLGLTCSVLGLTSGGMTSPMVRHHRLLASFFSCNTHRVNVKILHSRGWPTKFRSWVLTHNLILLSFAFVLSCVCSGLPWPVSCRHSCASPVYRCPSRLSGASICCMRLPRDRSKSVSVER